MNLLKTSVILFFIIVLAISPPSAVLANTILNTEQMQLQENSSSYQTGSENTYKYPGQQITINIHYYNKTGQANNAIQASRTVLQRYNITLQVNWIQINKQQVPAEAKITLSDYQSYLESKYSEYTQSKTTFSKDGEIYALLVDGNRERSGKAKDGFFIFIKAYHPHSTAQVFLHEFGHSLDIEDKTPRFDCFLCKTDQEIGIDSRQYSPSEYPSVMNYRVQNHSIGYSEGNGIFKVNEVRNIYQTIEYLENVQNSPHLTSSSARTWRNPERWEFQVCSPITKLPILTGAGSPTVSDWWTAGHAKWPLPLFSTMYGVSVLFWPRGRQQASTESGVS